jgi:hypothetical protein
LSLCRLQDKSNGYTATVETVEKSEEPAVENNVSSPDEPDAAGSCKPADKDDSVLLHANPMWDKPSPSTATAATAADGVTIPAARVPSQVSHALLCRLGFLRFSDRSRFVCAG